MMVSYGMDIIVELPYARHYDDLDGSYAIQMVCCRSRGE